MNMFTVIVLLVLGMFTGYFLKNRTAFIKITSRLTDAAIFLLLFFLGVSVGMNEQVVSNFSNIGLQAFFLTLMATFFSVAVTWLFHRLFFRKR